MCGQAPRVRPSRAWGAQRLASAGANAAGSTTTARTLHPAPADPAPRSGHSPCGDPQGGEQCQALRAQRAGLGGGVVPKTECHAAQTHGQKQDFAEQDPPKTGAHARGDLRAAGGQTKCGEPEPGPLSLWRGMTTSVGKRVSVRPPGALQANSRAPMPAQ